MSETEVRFSHTKSVKNVTDGQNTEHITQTDRMTQPFIKGFSP